MRNAVDFSINSVLYQQTNSYGKIRPSYSSLTTKCRQFKLQKHYFQTLYRTTLWNEMRDGSTNSEMQQKENNLSDKHHVKSLLTNCVLVRRTSNVSTAVQSCARLLFLVLFASIKAFFWVSDQKFSSKNFISRGVSIRGLHPSMGWKLHIMALGFTVFLHVVSFFCFLVSNVWIPSLFP